MDLGAERCNGLMAMLCIVSGIGAYATIGQMIPGIFWSINLIIKTISSSVYKRKKWFFLFNL